MQAHLCVLLVLVGVCAGSCAPKEKCSGELYYDDEAQGCRQCPKNAKFKNGTCVCPDQYEFVSNRCVLKDGAVIEAPDMPDSGAVSGASCAQYCDFAKVCIGDNAIAMAALSDVIAGLHADNPALCTSSCNTTVGGDGSKDPALACIVAGRDSAMCAGKSTQDGLAGGMGLLGDCCRTRQSNALCGSICKGLKSNAIVASMVDFCP